MRFPAIVLRDAVFRNMFDHAGISKRCEFLALSKHDMKRLASAFSCLERVELGVFPLRLSYSKQLFMAYGARWRELIVYTKAAWLSLLKRIPMSIVEEKILETTRSQ
jgi:hypothetical protein